VNCIDVMFVDRLGKAGHTPALVMQIHVTDTLAIGLDVGPRGELVPYYRMCGVPATFDTWFNQYLKETAT